MMFHMVEMWLVCMDFSWWVAHTDSWYCHSKLPASANRCFQPLMLQLLFFLSSSTKSHLEVLGTHLLSTLPHLREPL
jgi:hypothetical protein